MQSTSLLQAVAETLTGHADLVPPHPCSSPRPPLWAPAEMLQPPQLPRPRSRAHVDRCWAVLVMPFYPKNPHGSFGKHVLTPTLALTGIAAATPSPWHVSIWDENLLQGPPPSSPVPGLVGISVQLTFAERAYELARWYRSWGAKVVLGGPHLWACEGEASPHADAVAIGDGVEMWPRILNDAWSGKLLPRYEAPYQRRYAEDPLPRRDLLDRRSYLTTASVIATRGCKNRCGYCYLATRGLNHTYEAREVERVIEEIQGLGEKFVVFTDNNLGADPVYLFNLCQALKPLRILWSAAVTVDVARHAPLVREMAVSGCVGVFVGFESLDQANLRAAGKRTPPVTEYAAAVRLFHDHGIQVNGSFMLGFDGDTRGVFETTANWIEEHRLECATFHIVTPYPGTPWFRELEREGRLLHKDWSRYDTAHVVFRPQQMEPEELELGYDWLYRRLFSSASIWRRRPRDWQAGIPYLAMSHLYKFSNRWWGTLIRRRWVHAVWQPLIAWSQVRHLAFRARLERSAPSCSRDLAAPGDCRSCPRERAQGTKPAPSPAPADRSDPAPTQGFPASAPSPRGQSKSTAARALSRVGTDGNLRSGSTHLDPAAHAAAIPGAE